MGKVLSISQNIDLSSISAIEVVSKGPQGQLTELINTRQLTISIYKLYLFIYANLTLCIKDFSIIILLCRKVMIFVLAQEKLLKQISFRWLR